MYCLLVAGMPASGKSTIAHRLSETLRWPMFSKDSIKEIMYDDLGFNSREEKVKLGIAAMNIMYYAAAQLMRNGQPFILENNFEDTSLTGINNLLKKYHYKAITLRLTGDPDIIYQRFYQRELSPDRHPGHIVNDHYPIIEKKANHHLKTYEQYMKDIDERGFTRFKADGPLIEIDVTDWNHFNYEALVQRIQSCIKTK